MDDSALDSLTGRERDVLLLMAQGYRVAEIGPRLGVSTSTVETHLKSSRRKLGVSSSLLAARALYGEDAPPRNMGTALSGMVREGPATEEDEPAPETEPVGEHAHQSLVDGQNDRSSDVLGRMLGKQGNRNGLTKLERMAVWMLLSALVGIGTFASLAIPYLVEALRHH
jgi:DNA-binding CsgD family transcriptional regulator